MNKYKVIVFLIFFLLFSIIERVNSFSLPLLNKIIYIDPGHGGIDCGASYKELKESNLNLIYAKKIGKMIEEKGGIVLYTRSDDYDLSSTKVGRKKSDLSNRVKMINDSKADIYLSIHMNSDSNEKWHGTQVFYDKVNEKNKEIASLFEKQYLKNNISKRISKIIDNVYMYKRINIPGILIEIGFISNYADRQKLQDKDYIDKFSKVTVKSIIHYFK